MDQVKKRLLSLLNSMTYFHDASYEPWNQQPDRVKTRKMCDREFQIHRQRMLDFLDETYGKD